MWACYTEKGVADTTRRFKTRNGTNTPGLSCRSTNAGTPRAASTCTLTEKLWVVFPQFTRWGGCTKCCEMPLTLSNDAAISSTGPVMLHGMTHATEERTARTAQASQSLHNTMCAARQPACCCTHTLLHTHTHSLLSLLAAAEEAGQQALALAFGPCCPGLFALDVCDNDCHIVCGVPLQRNLHQAVSHFLR